MRPLDEVLAVEGIEELASSGGGTRGSTKRKGSATKPAAVKRSRKNELESAKHEIEVMGLSKYCSVLQFARENME